MRWWVLCLAFGGFCSNALGVDLRDLRPYLPAAKSETDHFILLCDNRETAEQVGAEVEKTAVRIWTDVVKKSAKVWSEKPIVALCGREADLVKVTSLTRQGQDYTVASLPLEGQMHRCLFAFEKDPNLLTESLPSLLSLHILETLYGSYDATPHWFKVGLCLRESRKASEERVRCRDAFRMGRRIPLVALVSTAKMDVQKLENADVYGPECLCFVDFFIAKVSPEGNKSFVDAVKQGSPVKACIGAAFRSSFSSPNDMEAAFLRSVDDIER